MPSLKVGLLGCGRIAQLVHLPVLTHLPGVELVAFAETDPERLGRASHHVPKAIAFDHYEKLLKMEEVEAVIICLPNDLHAAAAIASLQQGKHVYLEKPLATSLDEARRVLKVWQTTQLVGMIGFNYRFNPLYRVTRQHLQTGSLGNLVGARSIFSTTGRNSPHWLQTRLTGVPRFSTVTHYTLPRTIQRTIIWGPRSCLDGRPFPCSIFLPCALPFGNIKSGRTHSLIRMTIRLLFFECVTEISH